MEFHFTLDKLSSQLYVVRAVFDAKNDLCFTDMPHHKHAFIDKLESTLKCLFQWQNRENSPSVDADTISPEMSDCFVENKYHLEIKIDLSRNICTQWCEIKNKITHNFIDTMKVWKLYLIKQHIASYTHPTLLKPKNGEICTICLDTLDAHKTYSMRDCTHVFHKKCISHWMTQIDHNHLLCPNCKQAQFENAHIQNHILHNT